MTNELLANSLYIFMQCVYWSQVCCVSVRDVRVFCSKTCLIALLIRSVLRRKYCTSASSVKSNELTEQQDLFCFNHAFDFYTDSVKMVMNNKFKARTLNGNPTGNLRSIESRCVVT